MASTSAAPVAADASVSASATTTSGTNAAALIYKSIASEMLIGGITAQEEDARQTSLHESLMARMPPGVLDAPIVVGLTEQERSELQRVQQTGRGGPAVVGRTKPISEEVRFSGLDVAAPNSGGLGPAPNSGGLGPAPGSGGLGPAWTLGGLGLAPSSTSGPQAAADSGGPGAPRAPGTPVRVGHGLLQATPDGGFVWAVAIRSQGAGAIRVHVIGLDLPDGARLFFFSPEGQAFGPYSGKGPNGDGDLWTNTVFGSEGVILLRYDGPDAAAGLRGVSFVISDVGHITPELASDLTLAPESFCSFNAPCIENASCHSGTPADPAKGAVALMQWISGRYIYTCTGCLLNDTVSVSQIPYFLTANHCINNARDASNLEAYFQFSIPCGSTNCPAETHPGGIQRLGSTVLATGTGGDFTLLQLSQTPPSGSVFLGWNNAPVANTNGASLYRISHPTWAPQAYSDQQVDTSVATCREVPRGQWIYSRTGSGGTEGGSSGSPVVNASSQVVGQLTGTCGYNTGDDCDHVQNATIDGALAYYWPSVQPFLDPNLAPAEATNLRWTARSKDQLDWNAAANATSYVLYRGVKADLLNLLNSGTDSCTRLTRSSSTTGHVLTELPGAGSFYWYLVTGVNGSGEGSAGSATAGARIVNNTGASCSGSAGRPSLRITM